MILPAQTIRNLCNPPLSFHPPMIVPFYDRADFDGLSFGLSPAGYDVRIAESVDLGWMLGQDRINFTLASTIERFVIPTDILARVCDKSTWARRGLAVQNTVIEPGWEGHLTLELTFHANKGTIFIERGSPIAQIIFERLEAPTDQPYTGKYQNQKPGPQVAR